MAMDFEWLQDVALAADLAVDLDPEAKPMEERMARACLKCSLRDPFWRRSLRDLKLPTAALKQTKIGSHVGKGRAQLLKERSHRIKQVGARSQGSSGKSTPSSVGRLSPYSEPFISVKESIAEDKLEQCKNLLCNLIARSPGVDVKHSIQLLLDGQMTVDEFSEAVKMKSFAPLLTEQLPSLQQLLRKGDLIIDGIQINPALRNEVPPQPITEPPHAKPQPAAEVDPPIIQTSPAVSRKPKAVSLDEFLNTGLQFGVEDQKEKESSPGGLNAPVLPDEEEEEEDVDDGRQYFRNYVPGYLLQRTYDKNDSGPGGFTFGDDDDDGNFPDIQYPSGPYMGGPIISNRFEKSSLRQKKPELNNTEEFPSLVSVKRKPPPTVKVEPQPRKVESIGSIASSLMPARQEEPVMGGCDAGNDQFDDALGDAAADNDGPIVCIENLPLDCDKDALIGILSMYGEVSSCTLRRNEFGVCAFVEMDSEDALDWTIDCLNGESPIMAAEGQRLTCYKLTSPAS